MKNILILLVTLFATLAINSCSEDEDFIPTPIDDGHATLLLSGYQRIELGESAVRYADKSRPVSRQLILPIEQFEEGIFALFGLNETLEEFIAFELNDDQEFAGNALAVLDGELFAGEGFSLREIDEHRFQLTGRLTSQEDGTELPLEVTVDGRNFGRGTSTLTIRGDSAVINGNLGAITYNQILDLNADHRNVHTLIFQNVPGSENDEVNLMTGRLIREAGYSTLARTSSKIHSGGVDLFCSGKRRSVQTGAEFGIHSWCCGDAGEEAHEIPANRPEHALMIQYFEEMLGLATGEDFYFFTINSAPFGDLYLMTMEDILSYGLATD